MKNVKSTLCTFFTASSSLVPLAEIPVSEKRRSGAETKEAVEKSSKSGRERPHFSAFSRPKRVGSLPPFGTG